MILTKPSWVNNDGNPIFSVDIHPDGLRFATGGQGKDCGRVAIWNLTSVSSESTSEDENIPKLLCQLDNHLSCVNCVRWSNSGKYLASGGDDKLIMVWKLLGEPRFNENNTISAVEQWRSVGTLTGHSNDVLDLAWACHDSWLASCSVDNSVIVWNMDRMPEMLHRLTGHTGLVKGVTWDPVGQYLASQSDDKTLRIWRTTDWAEQVSISEPFKQCGDMTHVLRLNWSPDGQYLVSAHASNSGGPTARIIEIVNRPIDLENKSWSCEMDFVGHRKAVTCVKFNPNLLQKPKSPDSKQTKYCVLATGSRDCSVAIWCTSRRRPITVMNNLFSKSVLDLSWSKDGMQLVACSWDGSVAHFKFNEKILGNTVSEEEKIATLESLYGKSFATRHIPNKQMVPIMEFPNSLKTKQKETKLLTEETSRNQQARPNLQKGPTIEDILSKAQQIETRTADGKRRITPITVPRDCVNLTGPSFSVSSAAKTKIKVVKRNEVIQPNLVAPSETILNSSKSTESKSTFLPAEITPTKSDSNIITAHNLPKKYVRRSSKAQPAHLQTGTTANIEGDNSVILEISNVKDAPFGTLKKVPNGSRTDNPNNHWEFYFGAHILAVRSNKSYTVVVCIDHKMHILDTSSGCYVTPPNKLPGLPILMELKDSYLGIITTKWSLFVWNLATSTMTMSISNVDEYVMGESEAIQLASLTLTEGGLPSITLSCGTTYAYTKLGWTVVHDANDKITWIASQSQVVQNFFASKSMENGCLLKRRFPSIKKFSGEAYDSQACTVSFLQRTLQVAFVTKSAQYYKDSLKALFAYAANEGMISTLERLILNFFGESKSNCWNYEKLKIPKSEVVSIIAKSLKSNFICQRLYNEFTSSYFNVSDENPEPCESKAKDPESGTVLNGKRTLEEEEETPCKKLKNGKVSDVLDETETETEDINLTDKTSSNL